MNKGALLFPNDDKILVIYSGLAEEIGLEESLMLVRLDFLIKISSGNVFQENTKFTYQSSRDLQKKFFPFWSYKTVQRILTSLEDSNLIYRSNKNYNKHKYDKTIWYAINYKEVAKLKSIKVDWDVVEANRKLSKTLGQNDPALGQNDTSMGQNDPSLGQNDPTIPGYFTGDNTGKTSNSKKNVTTLRDNLSGKILTNKSVQTIVSSTYRTKDKDILLSLENRLQEEIKNGTPSQRVFWLLHKNFSQCKGYNLFSEKIKLDSPDSTKALDYFTEYEVDEKDFVQFYIKRWDEHKKQGRVWYPTWGRIISILNEYIDKPKTVNGSGDKSKVDNTKDWMQRAKKKV